LVSVHGVNGQRKRAVVEELVGVDLAGRVAEVVRQGHGQRGMDGLGVHDGWSCNVGRCTAMSINRSVIGQHCRRAHGLKVKAGGVVSRVRLQTLFGENPQYFMVTVAEVDLRRPPERRPDAAVSPPSLSSARVDGGVRVARLAARPDAAARPGTLRHGPRHVFEVMLWLRRRQFHVHLGGVDAAGFTAGYQLGRAGGGEAGLDSGAFTAAARGRRSAGSSFQHQVRSQDRLQNGDRVAGYRAGFQKAVCFFGVEDGGAVARPRRRCRYTITATGQTRPGRRGRCTTRVTGQVHGHDGGASIQSRWPRRCTSRYTCRTTGHMHRHDGHVGHVDARARRQGRHDHGFGVGARA
jgi:hypothetical protein